MRRHFVFRCAGAELVGTLDLPEPPNRAPSAGLLLVSGGNEVRAGAWNGQALLAARIAARGFAVCRFDRRGIGDSSGDNLGFRHSAEDIAAALAAFRREVPTLSRVIGFGNCDAASSLMLGGGLGCDGLVLSNPWTIEQDDAAPPPAALRAHYARRLRNPAALLRLIKGRVSLPALLASLRGMARRGERSALVDEIRAGLAGFPGPVAILLAGRDRTAQTFLAHWDRGDPRLRSCPAASHSYVEAEARIWLEDQIIKALTAESG